MAFLGDKAIGDIVKIQEKGRAVNYIIVHNGKPSSMYDYSCNGVWVLREEAYSEETWDYGHSNDYENSDIKARLGTFLNTIDEKIRAAIKTVKIPFKKGFGNDSTPVLSGSDGLSCKVFLLGGYEVGCTTSDNKYFPVDGAKLSYFLSGNSGASAKNKRICKDSAGSAVNWWLRSASKGGANSAFRVNTGGTLTSDYAYNRNWVRPAFILPPTLLVDDDGMLSTNTLPTITSSTASGSDLGEVSAPMVLAYTVDDADGDPMTVTEYLDDVQTRTYTAVLGAENTFEATSDPVLFQKILNGQHTVKVVANDTKDDSEPYTVTFDKQVKTAVISLANPLPANDVIKAAVISVTGNIPKDATLEVLVTNNALDESPVWEDMTQDYLKKINHVFANQAAVNGFAFNFRVTAARGASGEQGFISSIGGAFE